jgi:hypothetical protein
MQPEKRIKRTQAFAKNAFAFSKNQDKNMAKSFALKKDGELTFLMRLACCLVTEKRIFKLNACFV